MPELAHPVLELLKPKSGETILDLGCGDGALTLKIAEAGATVQGIDSIDPLPRLKARGMLRTDFVLRDSNRSSGTSPSYTP